MSMTRSVGRTRRLPSFVRRGAFVLLALITAATLYVHEGYLFRPHDPLWAHFRPFRWWLLPHVIAGVIALVVGPLQFSTTIRTRSFALHRWTGRVYAAASLVASALSVYIVIVFEDPLNRWVMGSMGGLWFITTVFAWLAARNREIGQHRLWAARSYCFTLTFVATRFVPDVILTGMGFFGFTTLYWALIVLCLVAPDLIMNGRAVLPWRGRGTAS